MPDIQDFTKASGEFLKANIVGTGVSAMITGIADVVHNDKFNTDRLHIPVLIDGKDYTFDCSKTNARVISAVLGDSTEKWENKVLQLETYRTKTSDGKMVDAINVKEVKL